MIRKLSKTKFEMKNIFSKKISHPFLSFISLPNFDLVWYFCLPNQFLFGATPTTINNDWSLMSVSKLWSPRSQNFITSRIFGTKAWLKWFCKVFEEDNMNLHGKLKNSWKVRCPKRVKKGQFSEHTYCSQNFRYETLKSLVLKEAKWMPHLPNFVWKP